MPEDTKNEGAILAPSFQVDGVEVHPWTFKEFQSLLPWAKKIGVMVRENKISLDALKTFMSSPENNIDNLLGVVTESLPLIAELIQLSTGKTIAECEGWPFDKTLSVALLIMDANASRLKNLFGLVNILMKTVKV